MKSLLTLILALVLNLPAASDGYAGDRVFKIHRSPMAPDLGRIDRVRGWGATLEEAVVDGQSSFPLGWVKTPGWSATYKKHEDGTYDAIFPVMRDFTGESGFIRIGETGGFIQGHALTREKAIALAEEALPTGYALSGEWSVIKVGREEGYSRDDGWFRATRRVLSTGDHIAERERARVYKLDASEIPSLGIESGKVDLVFAKTVTLGGTRETDLGRVRASAAFAIPPGYAFEPGSQTYVEEEEIDGEKVYYAYRSIIKNFESEGQFFSFRNPILGVNMIQGHGSSEEEAQQKALAALPEGLTLDSESDWHILDIGFDEGYERAVGVYRASRVVIVD